MTGTF